MVRRPGESFDPLGIPKVLKDAGFTAREIVVTATGLLARGEGQLELRDIGLAGPLVLKGGTQSDALERRADLPGKRIRVTGKLSAGEGSAPPALTVESFQELPRPFF